MVIVDRLTKYAIFLAAPKVCTADVATELFFKFVVKYFGIPEDIVSDRDPRFTELFKTLGSQPKFSTTYHPQMDGQTEMMDALLEEEYLRHYFTGSQKNLVDLLDAAQFAYNLQKSSFTEMSPFELNLGNQPLTPHEIAA